MDYLGEQDLSFDCICLVVDKTKTKDRYSLQHLRIVSNLMECATKRHVPQENVTSFFNSTYAGETLEDLMNMDEIKDSVSSAFTSSKSRFALGSSLGILGDLVNKINYIDKEDYTTQAKVVQEFLCLAKMFMNRNPSGDMSDLERDIKKLL
jgi:hypothetical protein